MAGLFEQLKERAQAITEPERTYRGPMKVSDVPVDLLTSSGSGLYPHISIAATLFQGPRIAESRDLRLERVESLIEAHSENKTLGVWGLEQVNVLRLNLALRDLARTWRRHDGQRFPARLPRLRGWVGKTFAMLREGRRQRERETEVVVGFVETHGRRRTADQVRDLEIVPRKRIVHKGVEFEEMDVETLLARDPEVALVDELAHNNVSGARNEKR